MFFVFICNLNCSVSEDKARNIIFDVMLKSKIFDRLDLSAEFYEHFGCRNKNLRKQVGFFEIESIDKPNVITIALNPKEYCERFIDHSGIKKHKELKKSTPAIDFDSYSNQFSDLTEYSNEFLNTPNKVEQLKSVRKVQFG